MPAAVSLLVSTLLPVASPPLGGGGNSGRTPLHLAAASALLPPHKQDSARGALAVAAGLRASVDGVPTALPLPFLDLPLPFHCLSLTFRCPSTAFP